MNKIIITILVAVTLTGCGLFDTRVQYRDKIVPIYTVPAPPEIERPELPIHLPRYRNPVFLANPDNIGQIAQDYTISLRLLLNYSQAQEEIIDTYRRLSQRDFANQPLLRSMAGVGDQVSTPPLFSGKGFDGVESVAFSNQYEFESYARSAFIDVLDKYEERKKEILKNETE